MKENFGLFGILAKVEAVAAKVKIFFAILAKVEVFYFFPLFLAIVFFVIVVDCVFMLVSGACPNISKAVEGVFMFGLLSFVFAFCGLAAISSEWDDAKKEVLIR